MEKYDMLKLRVLDILEKQGKTKYWLYKQLGMSYQNFTKMIYGKVSGYNGGSNM